MVHHIYADLLRGFKCMFTMGGRAFGKQQRQGAQHEPGFQAATDGKDEKAKVGLADTRGRMDA